MHTCYQKALKIYGNAISALVWYCGVKIGFEIPDKTDLIFLCIADDTADFRGDT